MRNTIVKAFLMITAAVIALMAIEVPSAHAKPLQYGTVYSCPRLDDTTGRRIIAYRLAMGGDTKIFLNDITKIEGDEKYRFEFVLTAEIDQNDAQEKAKFKNYPYVQGDVFFQKRDDVCDWDRMLDDYPDQDSLNEDALEDYKPEDYFDHLTAPDDKYVIDCDDIVASDVMGFTCRFTIESTLTEISDMGVFMRRRGGSGCPSELFSSHRWLADAKFASSAGEVSAECKPGTQIFTKNEKRFGSMACLRKTGDDVDDDVDIESTSAKMPSDYSVVLEGGEQTAVLNSQRDVQVDYRFTIEGPYDGPVSEDESFLDHFTVLHNRAGSGGADGEFIGGHGTAVCTYDEGDEEISCALHLIESTHSIKGRFVKLYNAKTKWVSPPIKLSGCEYGVDADTSASYTFPGVKNAKKDEDGVTLCTNGGHLECRYPACSDDAVDEDNKIDWEALDECYTTDYSDTELPSQCRCDNGGEIEYDDEDVLVEARDENGKKICEEQDAAYECNISCECNNANEGGEPIIDENDEYERYGSEGDGHDRDGDGYPDNRHRVKCTDGGAVICGGWDNCGCTEGDVLMVNLSKPSEVYLFDGVCTGNQDWQASSVWNSVVNSAIATVQGYIATDTDGDGVIDSLDKCEGYNDNLNADADDWPDDCDNCVNKKNNNQHDIDGDGIGDKCDDDIDGDDIDNDVDNCDYVPNPGQENVCGSPSIPQPSGSGGGTETTADPSSDTDGGGILLPPSVIIGGDSSLGSTDVKNFGADGGAGGCGCSVGGDVPPPSQLAIMLGLGLMGIASLIITRRRDTLMRGRS